MANSDENPRPHGDDARRPVSRDARRSVSRDAQRSAPGSAPKDAPTLASSDPFSESHDTVGKMSRTATFRHGEDVVPVDEPPRLPNLGRYELRRVLGRGAFGTVYLGWDPQLDRQVAIKVPRTGATDKAEMQRLVDEARRAAQFERHAGIVPVYDVGQSGDVYYIVAQYIEGGTLAERLKQQRPSLAESLRLAARLAETVHFTHTHGWAHRDIKPANILLDDKGNPYLADFGLTVSLEELRRGDIPQGTPNYLAPEMVRDAVAARSPGDSDRPGTQRTPAGEARPDHRADIYSLGVVLYELLTGRLPYMADTVGRLFDLVLHSDPPPPRLYAPAIPLRLQEVCLKALAKDPAERYQTADELAAQLNALAAVLEIEQPSGRTARRQTAITPLRAALISLATAAMVILAVVIYLASQRATGPDFVGEKPPQVANLDEKQKQEIQELVAQLRELAQQQDEQQSVRLLQERSIQPKIGDRGGTVTTIPDVTPPESSTEQHDPPAPLPIRSYAGTSDVPEELKRLEGQIEEAREAGDKEREFGLLQSASNEWLRLGDARRADKAAERMLEVAQGNEAQLAFAYFQLGRTRSELGEYDEALTRFQTALTSYRALHDLAAETSAFTPEQKSRMARLVGITLSSIGNVEKHRQHFDEAEAAYVEARQVLQPYEDRRSELAGVLMNLGTLYSRQARHQDAVNTFEQSLAMADSLDDDALRCDTLVNLGNAQARAGDNDAALKSYADAAEILTPDSAYEVRSLLLVNWTLTLLEKGQLEQARETSDQLRAAARADDDYVQRVLTLLEPVLNPSHD